MEAHGIETVEAWESLAARNREEAEAFLADNAKKKLVKTTPSGLQYQIITPGSGAIPKLDDRIKAAYTGQLIDGTVFIDTTNNPVELRVRDEFPGLTEALQMMPVGSRWKLFVPPNLAFAELGRRPPAGPNVALILDFELREISPPATPPVVSKSAGTVTPPIAVTFPNQKGGKIKVMPVDLETGEPIPDPNAAIGSNGGT